VLLDEANMPFSKCVRCDNCDGFPCVVHAKSDAEVIAVRPAIEHPNVTLLTDAEAVELQCNEAGTAVIGVVVQHEGETETFAGDIVVVSAGAANSARLLLASASDKHPRGLANGSDQVGRNFMFHNSQAVLALSKEVNPTVFQKTLGVNDFYFSGGQDLEFPLGNIQMVGKSQAPMFRGEKSGETRFAPTGAWRRSPATPSTSGSPPKTCRGPRTASRSTRTATSRSATRPATRSPRTACSTSSGGC
jgi:choline dehydrogenase-like flavoprotein